MFLTNLWKRGIVVTLVIALLISVVGCTPKDSTTVDVEDNQEKENVVELAEENVDEEPVEEIRIVDHLGREIVLEKEAERLVSGYYITSSMLIALGLKDNVVGIEAKADTRPIYALTAPELLDLPNVGTAKEFNLEGTIGLEPDLVILPIRLKEAVESLEKLGINVIAVNPEDMDLLKETLAMIGEATGTMERAERLIAYYDGKTEEIEKLVADKERKRVYLGGNSDFLSTATSKMYQNYMIETAGGKNVAGDIDDTYWANISYEQLIAYNPDIIIIAPGASYTKEDVLNDSRLASINAIQNNEVYVMPGDVESWDSPVPSSILGTMWLTSILNGEDYPYDKFVDDAVSFYEDFYNITIDREVFSR
ncbi:MAG: ABC transporter substrate-binding protein [Tissierellia bacterium]|nr:ABC transporter substrate-binding protein [Tissierellia bacterium]